MAFTQGLAVNAKEQILAVKTTAAVDSNVAGFYAPGLMPTDGSGRLSLAIYDSETAYSAAISKVLAKVASGQQNINILCIGDSTTAGDQAGLRAQSWVAHFAKAFQGATGLETNLGSIWCSTGKDTTATYTAYDPRLVFNGGWGIPNIRGLGGRMYGNSTDSAALAFTPAEAFDRIDVFYQQTSGNGTFTVDVGGAALATQATAGSNALGKLTVSTGAAAAVQTVNIKRTTGGAVNIVGISCYNSAKKTVNVMNAGWSSSGVGLWGITGVPYEAVGAISSFAPDLTFINLGINDWNAATTLATYISTLTTIINAAAVSGPVILNGGAQSDPAAFASVARYNEFVAAEQELARSLGIRFIKVENIIGDYAAANAAGFMGDQRHPNALGCAVIGRRNAVLLANS